VGGREGCLIELEGEPDAQAQCEAHAAQTCYEDSCFIIAFDQCYDETGGDNEYCNGLAAEVCGIETGEWACAEEAYADCIDGDPVGADISEPSPLVCGLYAKHYCGFSAWDAANVICYEVGSQTCDPLEGTEELEPCLQGYIEACEVEVEGGGLDEGEPA
jgi:hypothetical protein